MARAYWLGAIILPYLVVSACTSLSQDECRKGNWFEIGQNDGTKGRVLSYFKDHVKACKKHGAKPNKRQYEDGRNFGLARYCTPLSGFKVGRYSQTYQNVCPPESRSEFIRGYELGTQFGQVETQLSDVVQDIDEIESALRKDKIKADQKNRFYKQIDRLREEKDRLNREVHRIQTIARQTL